MVHMPSSPDSQSFIEQARRSQLLRAAIDTVNELGYPRASLSAIAQRAAVAKSAIGYYFSSKDALMMSVMEHVFGELYVLQHQAVDAHPDSASRLRAYAETYLAYVDTHRAEITAGIEIMVTHRNAEGVQLYLTVAEEDSAMLRDILESGMQDGTFRRIPSRTAVSIVESLLDVPTTELQRDLDADLSEVMPEIVRIVFRALEHD